MAAPSRVRDDLSCVLRARQPCSVQSQSSAIGTLEGRLAMLWAFMRGNGSLCQASLPNAVWMEQVLSFVLHAQKCSA